MRIGEWLLEGVSWDALAQGCSGWGGGRAVVRANSFLIQIRLSPSPTQQGPLGAHPDPLVLGGWEGKKEGCQEAGPPGPCSRPLPCAHPLLRHSSPPLGTRGVFWGHSPALLSFLAAVALSHRAPSSAARTTPARVRARPRGLPWHRVPAPTCHETCSARGSAGGGRRGDRAVGAGVRGGGQACAHHLVSDSCLVRGRCIMFSR